MKYSELEKYIQKAREMHLDDENIRQKLLNQGWPSDDITNARPLSLIIWLYEQIT